jgi:zinc protease
MNNLKNTLFFILLVLLSFKGKAQSRLKATDPLPLDSAVRMGKLANGFTYYIRHNAEPGNYVYLYLVNKVGSILEEEDQRGLAHFVEHMSFNGTKHFPKNELVDYLQRSGVRFGADLNANTSFDETVYQLPISTEKPDVLNNGFKIIRDWAQEATLDAGEIDKERGVVLEEKRLGKGANERMQRVTLPVLLNDSRYSRRLPIGIDTVLDNFKPEVIRRYYHDWYRPDLQALIVVGDIDVAVIEKLIEAQFGDLKNPSKEKTRTPYKIDLTNKNHFILVTDPELTVTRAEVVIKHHAPELKSYADYRLAIIRQLFNQMLGARYQELSTLPESPFVQGGATISGFIGGLDAYNLSVAAKPGKLETGFKAVWRETERLRRFGFTPGELERAKTSYFSSMDAAMKERDRTLSGSYVAEYQDHFLHGTASVGIAKEYEFVKQLLPGINLANVNALTAEYIKSSNRDIVIEAPAKEKSNLPNEKMVDSWITSIEQEKLLPYVDESDNKPLITHLPAPGKIVSEKQNKELDITELILSNGLKVVLKKTAFKNNEISFSAFASGGTSVYSDADYQSAANSSSIIASGGVGDFNMTQLEKMLTGKLAQVTPYISDRLQGVFGGSTNADVETALQLTYLYFTAPRKDEAMFKNIIDQSKVGLANRSNDPNSIFSDTASAVMGNYNLRRTGPSIAKVDQINLDKAYNIFKERFADASNFTFVFVGSIDTAKIKPLLEQYLGSLPAKHQHEQPIDLHINPPSGKVEKTVYKGREPKATVNLVFTGPYAYSTLNNLKIKALAEVLEIRLLERLREEESGVYSPSCKASYKRLPENRYSINISFGCAPQNVNKLVTSTLAEIDALIKSGPSQVNVDKYKAEHRQGVEMALKTNNFWLSYLVNQYQEGNPLDDLFHDNENIEKINPESLKNAANAYLNGNNFIRLVLMPEKVTDN